MAIKAKRNVVHAIARLARGNPGSETFFWVRLPLEYRGRENYGATEFYYYRVRFYSPALGTPLVFEQLDGLGEDIAHEMARGYYRSNGRGTFIGIRSGYAPTSLTPAARGP